jgi:ParB/RepB/Spo0J family partition protein
MANPMKIRRWEPDEIIITDRIRKRIKEDAVLKLMESIQQIGLREPPTIRIKVDADGCQDAILVAGFHRVEACKRLGLKTIDCVVFDGDETAARLWEIAENLHRAELTALERSEHLEEWRRLTLKKVRQLAAPSGGQQPKDKGFRKTAEEFKTSETDV